LLQVTASSRRLEARSASSLLRRVSSAVTIVFCPASAESSRWPTEAIAWSFFWLRALRSDISSRSRSATFCCTSMIEAICDSRPASAAPSPFTVDSSAAIRSVA
jgi:hypothetical protein